MANAFPLQWPHGWPRTPVSKRTRSKYKVGFVLALEQLRNSLRLLGAHTSTIIVSTNVPLRRDGQPYADETRFDDPGVAVYWSTSTHSGQMIACDRWTLVHENIHAIGMAVDALRAIERAGASQILERAFSAFGALPASQDAPVKRPWWDVLMFPKELLGALTMPVVEARYRELAPKAHPDRVGSEAAMVELNQARAEAKAHYAH